MTRQRWILFTVGAVVAATGMAPLTANGATTAAAAPKAERPDPELRNGVTRLLQKTQQSAQRSKRGALVDRASLAIRDRRGRIMVDLTPQAGVDRAAFRALAEARGLEVRAVDAEHGTLEGFIAPGAVQQLSSLAGTGTVTTVLRPATRIGAATSQGVALQRVDRVLQRGIDGKGITVGVLSDSFDTAQYDAFGEELTIHAQQDVASGDLPGKGNKRNPNPVVVIEDGFDPDYDSDEGRAMLQIVHDMAPAAKLCFATAGGGHVGFANNIRRLANKSGPCGADVIVDDISYYDEPYFSDWIISDAIDDVARNGVHYFSSAGNDGVQQGWGSPVRLVGAQAAAKRAGLDLSGVDPALYSGGLQDMDPGSGTDVAQDISIGPGGSLVDLQWDDPVDLDGARYGQTYFSRTGQLTDASPERSYAFNATNGMLGKKVAFRVDAIPSGASDLILTITDPNGDVIAEVDTGGSPELFATTLQQAGTYTITITGFGQETRFLTDVRQVLAPSRVGTDFNLLYFDETGAFVGATADDNPATGRPQELSVLYDPADLQVVIARAGTGRVSASRLRNLVLGDGYFSEYADPLSPTIYGHSVARGATAVAAYDPFKPFLPEYFTSPGGYLPIVFDAAGNRYKQVQLRQKPEVAGTDAGNTTFFVADESRDEDDLPNFSGTSASAPHVAAIAALVLQRSGGPRSLKPDALRSRLKGSTFAHDLDPHRASGRAGGLTLTASGPQGDETAVEPGALDDPNFFRLGYRGDGRVRSITFHADTASPTSLAGMVFDPRPLADEAPYYVGGFPFTVGSTYGGLSKGSVSATFAGTGAGDSTAGQFTRMTLTFAQGLRSGQGLGFGVDRDLASSGYGDASEGNGADELGGATFLPSGQVAARGMKFVARLTNGDTITGYMKNEVGSGFSPVDGFGLVNAERAVLGGP